MEQLAIQDAIPTIPDIQMNEPEEPMEPTQEELFYQRAMVMSTTEKIDYYLQLIVDTSTFKPRNVEEY